MDSSTMAVFTGNANPVLAQEIARHLMVPLGRAFVGHFSDGEVQVELMENVRGRDIFIVQSTCPPANDHLMELLVMADACRRASSDGPVAFLKGAPDVLLGRCEFVMAADGTVGPLTEADRQRILSANAGFAADALRVLGVARRSLGVEPFDESPGLVERHLVFLGLMAMKDPLRPEAKRAVQQCREAGIRTVMITGDHRDTALSIARELGLYDGDGSALTGAEVDNLNDGELGQVVERVTVFARVTAVHKFSAS